MSIAERLAEVGARIVTAAERAGRDPHSVTLVTVTKAHSLERVREAIAAGATTLGENRIEEAERKIPALAAASVEWHMIGHIQSRKASRIGNLFSLIHSLDRPKTAAILGREYTSTHPIHVLLEVNMSGESAKHGAAPADARALLAAMLELPGLHVSGLMTMAPRTTDPESTRGVFAGLRELRDALAAEYGERCELAELSMGMSNDFEVAIEEGATLVRIGTAIMGPR